MRRLLLGLLVLALALPAGVVGVATAAPGGKATSSGDYLDQIVKRSPAPEYRRYGTAAMANVANWAAGRLASDGYRVIRDDEATANRWAVDYTAGHAPLLTSGGHAYKTESAFDIGTTGPAGITCTVKKIADVGKGDCGFVPFADGSPEWKNTSYNAPADIAQIVAQGGVGAVVQGDTQRNLVYALRPHTTIPAVVSVVPDTIVGQAVTLRAMGASVPATSHNVIGILPPPPGSTKYIALTAHMDGWFQAAADNGGGAAAVLRAADLLKAQHPQAGVFVGLMDGEEYGLLGSQKLAAKLTSPAGIGGVHMADFKADVNLDASSARASDVQDQVHAVAGQDAPVFSWRAMVSSEEPTLTSLFLTTFAAHGVLGLPVTSEVAKATIGGGSWRTDAQWFHEAGVPAAWPVAGYPEYHTDGDLPSAMDKADLENVAQAGADLVGKIATAPIGSVPQQFR
jgi:Peptidase family M28